MRLKLSVDATVEPVSLIEAKGHMIVQDDDDDGKIDGLITAARLAAENFCRKSFVTTTWIASFDRFPTAPFTLPRPPLITVAADGIKYYDLAGVQQTLSTDVYAVLADSNDVRGRIGLKANQSFPSSQTIENAISVTYTAGYGIAASDVPQAIREAVMMLVGHWYEHPEGVVIGSTATKLPQTIEYLLSPYRDMEYT